jgi:CHAT domain-containing protein
MEVPRESHSGPVVVADPFFGEPDAPATASDKPQRPAGIAQRRSVTSGTGFSGLYFAPLAGTAQEARAIHSLFPEATLLTRREATKAALARLDAPRILHIASHGFFVQNAKDDAAVPDTGVRRGTSTSATIANPLLRAGLALAGANVDKSGSVLTALEASNLNLWGTKLVTLSACDTGVGEVRNGEGVYGLRRSFFLAGAETLVMSLWPVRDYVTREMMTAYYRGLKDGLGRGEALRRAQLAMLARQNRRHPFYWASFIQAGDWRPLDGR